MLNSGIYDPNEDLASPLPDVANEVLYSPNMVYLNKAPTPSGMNPSNHSSLSSPPQSASESELFPFDEFEFNFNGNGYQHTSSFNNLGTTLPMIDHSETNLINTNPTNPLSDINYLESDDDRLSIIAQPKAFYRERYSCEIDRTKNRAQRYIRAEDGSPYEHPTIKIPLKWRDPSRQLYIRVTSVTIESETAPYHCMHPYEIDTQENNVIRDNNSLYFPVSENEMKTGEKMFSIIRTKMVQNNLKAYGPFRLFDSNQLDCQRVENLQDAKQKIAIYQLWKSQFVFTIAEVQIDNMTLVPILHTSIKSQIITDETVVSPTSPPNQSNETFLYGIKCIPQQGNWAGEDEIVLIMPSPIKRKEYTIYFDFGQYGQRYINEIIRIDTKTLLFRTPKCPLLPGGDNLKVSIIIQNRESIISPIDFCYITPIRTTMNLCSRCQEKENGTKKKRRSEYDNAESLISEMSQLSIKQKTNKSHSGISSDENNSRCDKYLYQLRDSLEIFVRKNDPSQLFRRTRILLSKYTEDSSPLHDAIRNGHIQLASALIEQIIDMPSPNRLLENENENGETTLLIAGKFNQWKLIESILKSRSDLVKQKDKDGNNLFHLLANLSENKGFETIENILKILPGELKNILKEEKNQINQTPMDIAQAHGNTQCMTLLTVDIGKNNNN